MRLLAIRLTNFRSFASATVELPQGPGLYFMRGRNDAEPRLGANGSGKSTLWGAVYWALCGRTPDGLSAGDVCSWGAAGGARVDLELELLGARYTMTRSWKPNRWQLTDHTDGVITDLADDVANPVLAGLRLGAQSFLQCVLMGQGLPMFLDLGAEQKSALFSEVMGLDRWLRYSERASEKAAADDKRVRELETELARVNGALVALERRELELGDGRGWGKEQERRAHALAIRAADLKAEADELASRADLGSGKVQKCRDGVAELEAALAGARVRKDEADAILRKVREGALSLEAQRKEAQRRVQALEAGGKCPTCGQALSAAHPGRHAVKDAREHLAEVSAELGRQQEALEVAERSREEVTQALAKKQKQCDELLEALQHAQRLVRDCDKDAKWKLERAGEVLKEREGVLAERNPFAAAAEALAAQRMQLVEVREAGQRRLDDAAYSRSVHSMWVRGFKELRLQDIAQALTELEVAANSALAELGLHRWALLFDVDRETKSGTVQRGFAVRVQSPATEQTVPWKAWSGGERQRLRLAAQMGLADLIRARTGAELPLEVWDEPTANLSQHGIDDLLDALRERAHRERRAIWLVDHRSLSFGGFDAVCTVRKDGSGSDVEWER